MACISCNASLISFPAVGHVQQDTFSMTHPGIVVADHVLPNSYDGCRVTLHLNHFLLGGSKRHVHVWAEEKQAHNPHSIHIACVKAGGS